MRKLQSTFHRSFARFLYKFLSFENVQTSENVNLKRGDIACHFSQDDTVHSDSEWDFWFVDFCGEILFRNRIFAYHWSSKASRISKKFQKAKEIFEGRTKGQIGKKIELS